MNCLVLGVNDFQTWLDNNPDKDRVKQLNEEWVGENELGIPVDKRDFSYGNHSMKVKWKCKNNHIFLQYINYRTNASTKGTNCPFCGHETLDDYMNNNGEYGQQLREEYTGYDDKGNYYTPKDLTSKCGTRMIWKCTEGHEWSTSVSNRVVNKTQCPFCNSRGTSYPEQYIYYALKEIFPNAKNRVRPYKFPDTGAPVEYDVLIPSLKLYIEYNGVYHHDGKEEKDNIKRELAEQDGYKLIQIIDKPGIKEPIYTEKYIINNYRHYEKNNYRALYDIIKYFSEIIGFNINIINFEKVKENAEKYSHGKILREKSVAYNYPCILEEFSQELNPNVDLYQLNCFSTIKIHFICKKCNYGSKGEWLRKLSDRIAQETACPKCRYSIFTNKYKEHSNGKGIKSSVVFGEYTL